jgi:hypothetical protein
MLWVVWDKIIGMPIKATTRNFLNYWNLLWNAAYDSLQVPMVLEFLETHLVMLILLSLFTGVIGWLVYITFRDHQVETFREDDLILSEEQEKEQKEEQMLIIMTKKQDGENVVGNKREIERTRQERKHPRSIMGGGETLGMMIDDQHRQEQLLTGIRNKKVQSSSLSPLLLVGGRGERKEQSRIIPPPPSKLQKDNYENEFQWGDDRSDGGGIMEDLWHRFQRVQLNRKKLVDEQEEMLNVEEWDNDDNVRIEDDNIGGHRSLDGKSSSSSLQNRDLPKSTMIDHQIDRMGNKKQNVELSYGNKKEPQPDDDNNEADSNLKEKSRDEMRSGLVPSKWHPHGSVDRLWSNRNEMTRKWKDVDDEEKEKEGILSGIGSELTGMIDRGRIGRNTSESSSLMKSVDSHSKGDYYSRGMTIEEPINTEEEDDFELMPHQVLTIHQPIYDGQLEEEIHRQLDLIPPLSAPEPSSLLPLLSDTATMMRDGFSEDISAPSACFSSDNTSLQYSEEETYDDLQFPENGELRLKLPDPLVLSAGDEDHHHRGQFGESREKRGAEGTLEAEDDEEEELMNDLEIHEENFEARLLNKIREMQQQQRGHSIPDIGHHPSQKAGMGTDERKSTTTTTTVNDDSTETVEYSRVPRMPLFLEQLKQRNSEIVEEQEIEGFGVDIPMNLGLVGPTRDGGVHHEFGDGTELDHLEDMLSDERDTTLPKSPRKFSRSSSRKSSVQVAVSPMGVPLSPSKIPLHRNSNLRSKSFNWSVRL